MGIIKDLLMNKKVLKNLHLFEINIFCNITNVFTATLINLMQPF